MKTQNETFESLMNSFSNDFDLKTVFDDFLTVTITGLGMNPFTRKCYDVELYEQIRSKYSNAPVWYAFPKMFEQMLLEMQERLTSCEGTDLLGEFYERNLQAKDLTPPFFSWAETTMIAQGAAELLKSNNKPELTLAINNESCGSGRFLLAMASVIGRRHVFLGVDSNHICVKMTAINLFLHRILNGEVMWSHGGKPPKFFCSYQLSASPCGVYRISEKEESTLWSMHNEKFQQEAFLRRPEM